MASVQDIPRELLDAWNRRDFEKFRSLLHPEYSYMGGDGKVLTGGPDVGITVGRMFADAFPDGNTEIRNIYVQANTAVVEFIGRGTHKGDFMGIAPTGKRIEIHVCDVLEVRDGKIYREREYIDMAAILLQLGVKTLPAAARTATP